MADNDRLTQELKDQHQQFLSWAEMFDNATPAERKLIASHLIRAVTLTRGYGIQGAVSEWDGGIACTNWDNI